jgi:two-component system cell cycle sensor histidine kinase/response regulator CckA
VNGVLHVLMIEDSSTDAKLLTQELRKLERDLEVERVETAAAMRHALDRKSWDVVISDWSMPNFSAPAALAVLRERELDLPFIIVSGTIGEETAVEAMRAGAKDFVLKDNLGRLAPAVERELRELKGRTAHRQAEEALKQSETRFRRLAESGIIGVAVIDVEGGILEMNDAFIRMMGYPREDFLRDAVTWLDLTPADYEPGAQHALEQLRTSGVAQPWQTECLCKDGSRIPLLVGAAALDYPKCIAFMVDLTEQKRAEAGRLNAEQALRQSEEQLRQAQKMEAVGRLAGGVAHDFNNLLSVILSYGEFLLADLPAIDPKRGDIEEIRKAAERAAGLTRQLLLFSRQQVVIARVIDVHEVLAPMENMLQRILGEDVELVLVPPKSAGRVRADPSHIEQVIMNLAVNARDAMPTGGKLTIETVNLTLDDDYTLSHLPAKAGPYVMLAVTDTGTGIDPETQARIFEPFFTTKEKGKGTGLGLSTVFGIVQQSGGHVWVHSELGHGTTFKIYLPKVEAKIDFPKGPVVFRTLFGTETILLVEDEEQVRAVATSVLRRHGYRVLAARDPSEALVVARDHAGKLDLLLTDVVMPQMSGPELAKRLALIRPDLKLLYMSGYTDDSIVRHGVLDAGVAYLQKPITPTLLTRKVREVLDDVREPALS